MSNDFGRVQDKITVDIAGRLSSVENQLQKRFHHVLDNIFKLQSTIDLVDYEDALVLKHNINDKLVDYIKYSDYIKRNELGDVPEIITQWQLEFESHLNSLKKVQLDKYNNAIKSGKSLLQNSINIWDEQMRAWCTQNNQNFLNIIQNKNLVTKDTIEAILDLKSGQKDQSLLSWNNSQKNVFTIQQQLDTLKAACLINSEKIDHNLEILKKQEDENGKILNLSKRKQNQITDELNQLKDIHSELKNTRMTVENTRESRYVKMNLRIVNGKSQFEAMKLKLTKDFEELWNLKKKEMSEILDEIYGLNEKVSRGGFKAVCVNKIADSKQVQEYNVSNPPLLFHTIERILGLISYEDKKMIDYVISACDFTVPLEIKELALSNDDQFAMNLEHVLGHLNISNIHQYLSLIKSLKTTPRADLSNYIKQLSVNKFADINFHNDFWSKCIPLTQDLQMMSYDVDYKCQNYQTGTYIVNDINQLLRDKDFLINALK